VGLGAKPRQVLHVLGVIDYQDFLHQAWTGLLS